MLLGGLAALMNTKELEKEIESSLDKNIKMDCTWTIESDNVAADFKVSLYPPSARNLNEYLEEQQSTLTQSNPNVLFAANIKGYDNEWARRPKKYGKYRRSILVRAVLA